jgi:hypothetical protein
LTNLCGIFYEENLGIIIILLCQLISNNWNVHKHNILILYVHLCTFLEHISVVLFDRNRVENKYINSKECYGSEEPNIGEALISGSLHVWMDIIVGFDVVLLGKQFCCIFCGLLDTKCEGTLILWNISIH